MCVHAVALAASAAFFLLYLLIYSYNVRLFCSAFSVSFFFHSIFGLSKHKHKKVDVTNKYSFFILRLLVCVFHSLPISTKKKLVLAEYFLRVHAFECVHIFLFSVE